MLEWIFKKEKESDFEPPNLNEMIKMISNMTIKVVAPMIIEKARKLYEENDVNFDVSFGVAFIEVAILYYFTADTIENKDATLKNIGKWLNNMTDVRFATDMNKRPMLNEFVRCLYIKYSELCNLLNSIDPRAHVNRFDEHDFAILIARVTLNMKNYSAIRSA